MRHAPIKEKNETEISANKSESAGSNAMESRKILKVPVLYRFKYLETKVQRKYEVSATLVLHANISSFLTIVTMRD